MRAVSDRSTGPRVHKFGGSCLSSPELTLRCADIVKDEAQRGNGVVVVVSALKGQTNLTRELLVRLIKGEDGLETFMEEVRARHQLMVESTIVDRSLRSEILGTIEGLATRLERLLWGVVYTEELTPRLRDQILTHGERMSAHLFSGVVRGKELDCVALEADQSGVVTDGVFGTATANLEATSIGLGSTIMPILKRGGVPVLTGFFGADMEGHATTFGKNGSDYSAAVAARALRAPLLTLWKDVPGFLSADPRIVPEAHLLPSVTFEEAAELAYFGLDVLHPRTVEPLRPVGIPIQIRSINAPDVDGSIISPHDGPPEGKIKSVTSTGAITMLKLHAVAIGVRPGFLAAITKALAEKDIQALGLSTSQACLGVLLRTRDAPGAIKAIKEAAVPELERIERIGELALVGAVGSGAIDNPEVTTSMMDAVADLGSPVVTVALGPSTAAIYFVVEEAVAQKAVKVVHGACCNL